MCVCVRVSVCVCMCVHASVHAKICLLVFIRYSDGYRTSQSDKVEQTMATLCRYIAWNVGYLTCNCTYTFIYVCVCVCVCLWVYVVR